MKHCNPEVTMDTPVAEQPCYLLHVVACRHCLLRPSDARRAISFPGVTYVASDSAPPLDPNGILHTLDIYSLSCPSDLRPRPLEFYARTIFLGHGKKQMREIRKAELQCDHDQEANAKRFLSRGTNLLAWLIWRTHASCMQRVVGVTNHIASGSTQAASLRNMPQSAGFCHEPTK